MNLWKNSQNTVWVVMGMVLLISFLAILDQHEFKARHHKIVEAGK